ncbi:MAG: hypothetical protein BAA00_12625 [Parageobacillus thermoglucosidasius]|nr:MAG: hypothetical protein BAA00_12625 [Parageobacillus thermoglucosidasius]
MVGRTFILQEIRQARAIFYACLILSSTTGKIEYDAHSPNEVEAAAFMSTVNETQSTSMTLPERKSCRSLGISLDAQAGVVAE